MYNKKMTGLYVHIPFCAKKCHYCNFVITLSGSAEKRARFLSALEKEASHWRDPFRKISFDTLYVGGGTPSAMSADEIGNFFSTLRKNFSFREKSEITFEANPGDITDEKAALLKKLGVNRISLGAQSFHDKTLKSLNRSHGSREIYESVEILRNAGLQNVNLDLILSLPEETLEEVKDSLAQAVRLLPQHISLYELTIEKKTVFGARHEKGDLPLPDEEAQIKTLSFARDFLKKKGFLRYELLNYAKKGFESRHNLLYWANGEYLGLGPGAFSYFDGRRFRHSENYQDYLSKAESGDWSAFEEETLDAEKKEIESFLLSLRKTEGASLKKFSSLVQSYNGSVDDLIAQGLLLKDENKISLSPRGRLFAETVFSELSAKN